MCQLSHYCEFEISVNQWLLVWADEQYEEECKRITTCFTLPMLYNVHWWHWGYLRVIESYLRVIWGSDSNLVFNPGPRVCPFSFQFPKPLILLNIIFAHCWNCRSAVYLQLFLLYLLDNLSSTLFILTHWLNWFPPRIVQLHLLTAQLSVLLCLLLVTGCGGWPAASQ